MVTKIQLEDLKQAFLANGGTLLRKATTESGEPIIEHCNKLTGYTFKTRLTYSNEDFRNKTFDYLTRKRKQFFKSE